MNSTPPELSRNLALLEKIWFAGTLTDKVFKKKYNSNQIMAIDTSQAWYSNFISNLLINYKHLFSFLSINFFLQQRN